MDDWSFTVDAIWIDTSEFGMEHVSVGPDHVSVPSQFKDSWAFSAGLRHQYRSDLALSVGAGVEWHWKGYEIHNSLNYADFGDGKID